MQSGRRGTALVLAVVAASSAIVAVPFPFYGAILPWEGLTGTIDAPRLTIIGVALGLRHLAFAFLAIYSAKNAIRPGNDGRIMV